MSEAVIPITAEDAANCVWELEEVTPEYRRYVGRGTHPVTGQPILVRKTEYLHETALLVKNHQERMDSQNQRWTQGSGSDKNGVPLVKVASVPLNVWYSKVAPREKDGDNEFLKWFLGREESKPFRTKEGTL